MYLSYHNVKRRVSLIVLLSSPPLSLMKCASSFVICVWGPVCMFFSNGMVIVNKKQSYWQTTTNEKKEKKSRLMSIIIFCQCALYRLSLCLSSPSFFSSLLSLTVKRQSETRRRRTSTRTRKKKKTGMVTVYFQICRRRVCN
jgi:hypothetical protein